MPTLITAGGASDLLALSAASDGALTLQTGPSGAKVNALALDASGNAAFLGTVSTPRDLVRGARTAFTAVAATTLINTIPSWATEIVVLLSSFGTNGASQPVLRLGPSGGPETTGYLGATGAALGTTGIALTDGFSATGVAHIVITLRLIDAATNTWMAQGSMSRSDGASSSSIAATKPLAGALTQLQVTTTGGTDTMDTTGFYNVWYR